MPISVAISESQLVIAPIDSDSRASLAAAAASGANEWACMIAQPQTQTQINRAHTLLHLRKKFRALNLKRDPPDQPNVDECVDERLEKSEKNRRGIV